MGVSQQFNFLTTFSPVLRNRSTLLRSGRGALLTFLPLLLLTVWLWWNALSDVTQSARERFEFRVSEAQFAIEQRLLAYEQVLRGGVGLFAASDQVTRDEWRTYVRNLDVDTNYPGIQGFGFSKRVLPSQREAHIQSVRADGFLDYTLWPGEERSEYTAIVYLEPFDWRNQRAFGYDMFSEPVRHEAMVRARDTALPAMSGRVTLVQETGQAVQHGFLMYLPVYPKGVVPETVEARRAALVGYVYSPFRMSDLMRGILGRNELPDIHLQVFDGAEMSPGNLMYDSLGEAGGHQNAAFSNSKQYEINGHSWTLQFSSLPAFDATIEQQRPRLLLISGLLVSVLFAAVVWALSLNRRHARDLVATNSGLQAEIAERKKLSMELERAKNDAEAANRAKSEFLANVSHELRTPLTLILAPLESLLASAMQQPHWQAPLERIQRNALLLLNRVSEILDFAKAESGKFELCEEWVDLGTWLAPLAEDAAVAAERKGGMLTFDPDPALGRVCIDSGHFEKIAMNLVSNALKFTPEKGSIRLELRLLDDNWFEFAVADTGPGIAKDQQARLFHRFHQVNAASTRRHGGTGIGLALVKELTELMGGEVGLTSDLGQGSRFFVRLPRGTDRIVQQSDTSNGHSVPDYATQDTMLRLARFQEGGLEAPTFSGTPKQRLSDQAAVVLVVDDTPDMRDFIAEMLAGDFEVLTANDGLQAWQLLQHHRVDIVVSDVMMPELDGLGLTNCIKASTTLAHLPVILVTARGGAEASVSGLESGADDYIAKPFSPQELQARVHSALRMAQVQAQLREKSREAGMAMLATGILHNLGNALNGVTVSSGLIQDRLRDSKATKLHKTVQLLQQHVDDLPGFLAKDPAGRMLPDYLGELSRLLETEQAELLSEVAALRGCTEYAAEVVAAHQRFATAGGVQEMLSARSLMDTALKLGLAAFDIEGIQIEQRYYDTDDVAADRHKVLQILINLLVNACQALLVSEHPDKRIMVRTVLEQDAVVFEVSDNGIGIDSTALQQLFDQGYTTKGGGHGFGLHLSATWAQEMRGSLQCHSDGVGLGATFRLALPIGSPTTSRGQVAETGLECQEP